MSLMQIDLNNPSNNSGKNISFLTLTNSGSIAGLDACVATAFPETFDLQPVIYKDILIELNENVCMYKKIQESNDIWLKLSESSFGFWDNDLDSKYDLL